MDLGLGLGRDGRPRRRAMRRWPTSSRMARIAVPSSQNASTIEAIEAIQSGPVTDSTGSGVVPALRTLGGSAVVDVPTGNPIGFNACVGSTAKSAIALRSNEVGFALEPCRTMGSTRSGPRSAT